MAPLQTALADTTLKNQTNDDEAEFQGRVDPTWRVISVLRGGVNHSVQHVANGLLKWLQGTCWRTYFALRPNSRVQLPQGTTLLRFAIPGTIDRWPICSPSEAY